MPRNPRDYYYRRARKEGYRSRASYKLLQLNERYGVIKPGAVVVDLGAAPGGWLQVARELSGGVVVGVDLLDIPPLEGVTTLRGDIRSEQIIERILSHSGGAVDVVLCDAAPNLSGNWSYDHARSIELSTSALKCARQLLKNGGNFVVKVFQGDMFNEFLEQVRGDFNLVRVYSPPASRPQSAEVYVVAKGYLSAPFRRGDVFDVRIEGIGANGDGVARVEGVVVFVSGAEEGESVRIEILDVKPRFAFARRVEGEQMTSER